VPTNRRVSLPPLPPKHTTATPHLAPASIRPPAAHSAQLAAVDVSPDGGGLLAVGQDALARQTIAVWDVSAAGVEGRVSWAARAPDARAHQTPDG
jgi:hypothetical protein